MRPICQIQANRNYKKNHTVVAVFCAFGISGAPTHTWEKIHTGAVVIRFRRKRVSDVVYLVHSLPSPVKQTTSVFFSKLFALHRHGHAD